MDRQGLITALENDLQILREVVRLENKLKFTILPEKRSNKYGQWDANDTPQRRSRKKLHWTQRPENKAKVRKMARKSAKARSK